MLSPNIITLRSFKFDITYNLHNFSLNMAIPDNAAAITNYDLRNIDRTIDYIIELAFNQRLTPEFLDSELPPPEIFDTRDLRKYILPIWYEFFDDAGWDNTTAKQFSHYCRQIYFTMPHIQMLITAITNKYSDNNSSYIFHFVLLKCLDRINSHRDNEELLELFRVKLARDRCRLRQLDWHQKFMDLGALYAREVLNPELIDSELPPPELFYNCDFRKRMSPSWRKIFDQIGWDISKAKQFSHYCLDKFSDKPYIQMLITVITNKYSDCNSSYIFHFVLLRCLERVNGYRNNEQLLIDFRKEQE